MEILAAILGVTGAVWLAVLFRRGGLLAGCLAVLLAGACLGVEFFKLPLGPVPLTVDRMLFVLLVAYYFYARGHQSEPLQPFGKPEILLCLFLALIIAGTLVGDFTVSKYQPLSWMIIYYIMPVSLYMIARQATWNERTLTALFASLTAFGVYLSLTAVAEYYEIWPFVFPTYITKTAATATTEFVGRARGPFLNPISNGMVLIICLSAALFWHSRRGRLGKMLFLPMIGLIFLALYFTLTRSIWMGTVFALACVVGLSIPMKLRLPLLGGGLIAILLVVVAKWDDLVSFKRDRNLDASKTAESVELRPIFAQIAWNMFKDRPLFGCGYAQYGSQHIYYLADRSTDLALERGRGYVPHNVFLSLLTETGLIGLSLFLVIVGAWTIDAWHLWKLPTAPLAVRQQGLLMVVVVGVYFINGMFHEVSISPMSNMLFYFMAGTTAGLRPYLRPATGAIGVAGAMPVPTGMNVKPNYSAR